MLDITARITRVMPTESGVSGNGPWTKSSFLLETEGPYPETLLVEDFNDRANSSRFAVGEMVKVTLKTSAREHKGRYYNTISAWRIEPYTYGGGEQAAAVEEPDQTAPPVPRSAPSPPPVKGKEEVLASFNSTEGDDDLPF